MISSKKSPAVSGPEKAILIGTFQRRTEEAKSTEYLDELEFLADTAGANVVRRFQQRLDMPHPKTYLGSGKMQEVRDFCKAKGVDLVIFDDELTPSQLKNIEGLLSVKVMDRTHLILDIFAARARTSHARTQVELAQYEYLLPRLTKMWTTCRNKKEGLA